MRILVAGFQHETNTFAVGPPASYDSFVNGEGFPALRRGDSVHELEEVNIPMGGFLKELKSKGITIVPVIWAGASPSAPVTRDTYEKICGEITSAAAVAAPDAIYLDLHGAMVAEHHDDGEGELLTRLRAIVGERVPIVASLDLHANVTTRMVENADALVAYRTYPHTDMAETGARAAGLLLRLTAGETLHCVIRRIPFLIPINAGCTLTDPAGLVYEKLGALGGDTSCMSFAAGFPSSDFPECGPTVWGYGSDRADLERAVELLYNEVVGRESEWMVSLQGPSAAVGDAIRIAGASTRPVIIADTQDNPGAGGNANTMGIIRALLDADAERAIVGAICDPDVASAAHAAGPGQPITVALGGQSSIPGDEPLKETFVVERVSDGRCRFGGPMMRGNEIDQGPSACLRIGGVRIVVTTWKSQLFDRNQFRMVGLEPEDSEIVVVKSSVHFRADFQPIAHSILVAKAPGPVAADPSDLPWQRLASGIRIGPLGVPFGGQNLANVTTVGLVVG
ncbi:M81 family metallopeptidase [Rhodococcus sp. IEGM 248]|uniref:M81 family metallopeptidase n=1 Tax=Rhodococcus koreensis TaxID=99653 RepID=UPI0010630B29|nr:M81 family metallopeptidase [Rhodococcus koreensis]NDV05004.1 M81 family metallopeptidase [Rhodococcus sp. IEGM 248]QSE86679.1 M81 family metallopeptidase [Rhodococcus koreensis]